MIPLTEKQQHWADIVDGWSTSGLSQADYCRQKGVNIKSFYAWKHIINKKRTPMEPEAGFMPLSITPEPPLSASPSITLSVNGIDIRYRHDTDETLLSQLIQFLRGHCDSAQ